ncbi:MFS general substrate transporter [Ascobolus immersus RN42]|uniref:MFS general substrate transporter n=1 Tax=Ascobolus immersus RN42 TaxID=1160509 RepID=A0A3N4I565_ASCIM|nr:MFS general substrate transporter [Ascobolus immersus RN42]
MASIAKAPVGASSPAAHKSQFSPAQTKSILKILFFSLLLDLLSFTLILPLFPRLLDFYKSQPDNELLNNIFRYLNAFKEIFHRPISDRFDVVLLGGAMGSLFSLLQAFASPIIGGLSDKYGRRTALLYSMAGNILSVLLWYLASSFPLFLASRIVGGLSEGNVQLAIAIATDISPPQSRNRTLALVGVAFSIAFTIGPMMGAYFSMKTMDVENPFAATALFSLALLVVETAFLAWKLPETRPVQETVEQTAEGQVEVEEKSQSIALLNWLHFFFLFIFSGMEFSLPFMTYDLFSYTSAQSGKLLGFIGLLASLLQGGYVRRAPPLRVAKTGLVCCVGAFFLLAKVQTEGMLYLAAAGLAGTSACVVTGLTALASLKVAGRERGRVMGGFRSAGQIGRAIGPIAFCSLYWWAGRTTAYLVGGSGMVLVAALAWCVDGGGVDLRKGEKEGEGKKEL